ncbi:hypothetical protein M0R45_038489 [Rubus argutus]|uniref:Uncharacterized protein n=1 Tax=Rubus argutus TaxID=59490 RepID=A0AAW1W3L6_RUBAR
MMWCAVGMCVQLLGAAGTKIDPSLDRSKTVLQRSACHRMGAHGKREAQAALVCREKARSCFGCQEYKAAELNEVRVVVVNYGHSKSKRQSRSGDLETHSGGVELELKVTTEQGDGELMIMIVCRWSQQLDKAVVIDCFGNNGRLEIVLERRGRDCNRRE